MEDGVGALGSTAAVPTNAPSTPMSYCRPGGRRRHSPSDPMPPCPRGFHRSTTCATFIFHRLGHHQNLIFHHSSSGTGMEDERWLSMKDERWSEVYLTLVSIYWAESFSNLREWCNIGMSMDDMVQKMVLEKLKRLFPEVFNDLFQRLERKDTISLQICAYRRRPSHHQTCTLPSQRNSYFQSSAKTRSKTMIIIILEIVVLDGDFPRENSQDWNTDEFNSSILEKQKSRRSLFLGESKAPLHQGIASFGTLQKPHPPSLDHEVWRLLNIGRNGAIHKRLDAAGIKTVHDFLKLSVVDQQCLRETIKMSDKKWEETIRHERTCKLGDDLYLYDVPPFTVKLNPICEVVEVKSNGVTIALTELTSEEKVKLASEAYQNWNRLDRVPGIPTTIGAQKQRGAVRQQCDSKTWELLRVFLNSFLHRREKCELVSDEPRCSNPPDGSQGELSAGNVTPRLGASACVLEQLPSPQRVNTNNILDSIRKCELVSDEPRCSNPPDGSQGELSAGNVTPRLGASACVLEQLPSPQRAGAENQNRNPWDSNGGTMEAQQQSDHFGDQDGPAALWSLSFECPCLFCSTGESLGELNMGDV
ncbi:hypothetical protein C4D60_Mb01t05500 [Musa balbisiana]|uniref:Uncharacterized protein n=1 Tax=Musa balbisiana TaxID=52838 RepID=A0A4S8JKA2_MUSBA|nr:hypothetical protein C4D60_Mb01t05500 [Musa balbisiana]